MITVRLEGLDDAIAAIGRLPTAIDRRTIHEDVAAAFADRLRAATPVGYSRRLQNSVVYSAGDTEAAAGYEPGVETAGRPELDFVKKFDSEDDSVMKPSTRGGSVLREWIRPESLESVLEETFDAYAADGVSMLEKGLADGIS